MTDFDEFERRLAAAIRSDADLSVGPFTPESIARAAIADAASHATRVRRPSPAGRPGRGRGMMLLAAAAILVVGGALAGSGILRILSIVPVPAPSFAALATASPDATTTPAATPSGFVSPSPAALSLDVTWTQLPIVEPSLDWFREASPRLAWLGDRFVLVDVDAGVVRTSTDGQDWQAMQPGDAAQSYVDLLRGSFASWQERAVGWWNPQDHEGPETAGAPPVTAQDVLQIVRPPAAPTSTSPFKGRIESLGIGPKGIVAQVHSHLDWDDWVRRKLGARTNNEWVTHVKSVDFLHGVLNIKMDNGPGLRVVWADEGFEPGDFQDRGFGWYSPDGEQWTAMAPNGRPTADSGSSLPTGSFGSVVGVSDGFIATGAYPEGTCADPNGSCTGMWYSADGLTWRLLGTAPEMGVSERELCIRDECHAVARELLPWKGGALAIYGDGRIAIWTSGGPTELQIAAQPDGTVATGPLGIVSLGDGQVLVSRDGVDYKVSSIPAPMADPANGGGGSSVVAVGDRAILVLASTRTGEFTVTQSLWLGTFEP
jgi:hypothetical protein